MKMLEQVKEILQRHKEEVVREYKVKEIGIFGSIVRGEQTMKAVVWQIHIIGEATKNIPESIKDKYKEVP